MSSTPTPAPSSVAPVEPGSVNSITNPVNAGADASTPNDVFTSEKVAKVALPVNGALGSQSVGDAKIATTVVAKVSDQTSSAKKEGLWRVDAPYVSAKVLRLLLGSDGTFQGSYLEGTVTGWLPSTVTNTTNSAGTEPAGIWHVRYDKVRPGHCRCLPLQFYRPHHLCFPDLVRSTTGTRRSRITTRTSWTATRCAPSGTQGQRRRRSGGRRSRAAHTARGREIPRRYGRRYRPFPPETKPARSPHQQI